MVRPAPHRTERIERRMKNLMKKVLSVTLRMARGMATMMGLEVMLALTIGLASTALAGTGVGARLDLGKTNTVNAVTSLVGSVTGPTLTLDNNCTGANATALNLQVEPGKPPFKVNSTTEVQGHNVDQVDGQSAGDFLGDDDTASHPLH
jgi:hypothetical protein